MTLNHDTTFVRYLLGEMSDKERDAFEDEYFADPVLAQRLEEVETRLIDTYVRGGLPEKRRAAVERRYLETTEGRARLDVARALAGHNTGAAHTRSRRWVYPFAALAASALIVTGILARRSPPLPTEAPQGTRVEAVATAPAPAEPTPTFKLSPGATRSPGEAASLVVPPSAETVYLDATVIGPTDRTPLTGMVSTPEGIVVHRTPSVTRVPNVDATFRTTVPARVLPPGDYILKISAGPEGSTRVLGEFAFRVRHQ